MPQLKVHDDFKVAVVIDGSSFITSDEGVLYEYVGDNEVFLYIKSRDDNKEIKIKIVKEDKSI